MEQLKTWGPKVKEYWEELSPTKKVLVGLTGLVLLGKAVRSCRSGKSVEGEVAFITGAASGIGRQTALQLAAQGCKVVIADINEPDAKNVAFNIQDAGGKALAVHCDVTKEKSIKEALEEARNHFGPITILVNNAGIVVGKPLLETSIEETRRVFEINTISHFVLIKEVLPEMIAGKKGHIVTIASAGGYIGVPRLVDYCSSKFAAVGLDDALRAEMMSEGHHFINFTSICPYFINTGMFAGVKAGLQFLMPILNEEWIGKRIVRAIRMEEEVVICPGMSRLAVFIKAFLGPSSFYWAQACFGTQKAMNTFTGRNS